MSAFLVSRETIHDTVALWRELYPVPDPNALGWALWDMNVDALRQRYPHIPVEDVTYVYGTPSDSRAQLAKSSRCLRYQCSEGDIPETSSLFKQLDALCDAVGEPVGFDDAIWDR